MLFVLFEFASPRIFMIVACNCLSSGMLLSPKMTPSTYKLLWFLTSFVGYFPLQPPRWTVSVASKMNCDWTNNAPVNQYFLSDLALCLTISWNGLYYNPLPWHALLEGLFCYRAMGGNWFLMRTFYKNF